MIGTKPEKDSIGSMTLEERREQVYAGLRELIPLLLRRECTPRIMRESGADFLLDQLILVQREEAFEMLCDPEEVGYGLDLTEEEEMQLARNFNRVFGGNNGN